MSHQPNFDVSDPRAALRLDKVEALQARRGQTAERVPVDGAPLREVHLLDYVKVLYKRRWTAITAFVLIMVFAAVDTFTEIPLYEARTRLLIESDERNVVSFKQVVEEDQARQDYYQTQYNILQSRALARRTLDELKLWDRPPFGGVVEPQFSLVGAVAGAPAAVLRMIRRSGAGAGETPVPASDETAAQSRGIDALLANLRVTPIRNSRLVDVKYRLPDPVLATDIVNALARGYIEQNLEYKFLASKEATDWLGARLAEQRQQVEAAEARLQQYREQNDAIAMEDRQNIVVQKLSDLNAAVTRAKTERIQKEATYSQLQQAQADPGRLDTFPAILTNSFIQQQKGDLAQLQRQSAQLSEKLGDRHPDMIKLKTAIEISQTKLAGEIGKVVQSVRSEYQAAVAQERSLTAALNQQKNEALAMNRKAIDYGVLERDVQSSKQLYDALMQRAKETGVSGELKTSNIRVIDSAETPRGPVSPQTRRALMMGLLWGSLAAFGLVFFFEYMDRRIKSPEDIRQHLRLPYLGLLPLVSGLESTGSYPLVHTGARPDLNEAFRSVRTNLLFSSAQEELRSFVVTSTGAGEGKSMVAANLAISLAQTGQRVLLIDADLRKPRMHEVFSLRQEPGLSNLLVGNSKASECVHRAPVAGLWLLCAGRIPPNPAELLGSRRFTDFLASLKDHFDWVIVDSPPVMAVTDAALLAHAARLVVFVVGAEMTSRHAARRAIEQLQHARGTVLGAVLNRVDLEQNPYYYSPEYQREYVEYYQKPADVGRV